MIVQLIRSPHFYRRLLILVLVSIALIALSVFFVDQAVARYSGDPANIQFWLFNRHITEIGKSEGYFILAIVTWLVVFAVRKKRGPIVPDRLLKWKQWAEALFICLITSGIAIHMIKPFLGRLRPHKSPDFEPLHFHGFTMDWDWQSFPSGHSQTLFCVATLLALAFPQLTVWILILAAYLSMTRAFTVAHFTSDVIGGATIGFVVTVLTLFFLATRKRLDLDLFARKKSE